MPGALSRFSPLSEGDRSYRRLRTSGSVSCRCGICWPSIATNECCTGASRASTPPHVIAIYERFGMPAIKGAIDSYEYGTEVVGGILSLRDLRVELLALSDELGELADQYRGTGKPAPPAHPVNW